MVCPATGGSACQTTALTASGATVTLFESSIMAQHKDLKPSLQLGASECRNSNDVKLTSFPSLLSIA